MNKHCPSLLVLLLPLVLGGGACSQAARPRTAAAQSSAHQPAQLAEIRVEGELGRSPFGCAMVRTADGSRYSLARDLEGSAPGQKVWVEGYLVESKSCMPGQTLMPRRAGVMPGTETKETRKARLALGPGGGF